MMIKTTGIAIATIALLATVTSPSHAAVIDEDFEGGANPDSLGSFDWTVYRSPRSAATVTNTTATTNQGSQVNNTSPINGSSSMFLSADPLSGGSNNNAGQFVAGVDISAQSLAIGDADTLSFTHITDSGSSSTAPQILRIVIQVGTDWYISASGIAEAASATAVSFDFATELWKSFEDPSDGFGNLAANSTGGGSAVTTGNLNFVGIALASNRRTDDSRIDDVVLTEVPEPASLALLAIGGLVIARRR